MKMSKLEHAAKNQIIDILNKQGYPTYSRLLDKLDVKLIDTNKSPEAIAYLDTRTATIYLNPNLNIEQVSTIVRHEILHEYLTHMARAEKFKQSDPKYKNIPHNIVNIAADYEISNRGYTEKDKDIARSIILKDQILRGLVTEDEHADWVNKTFEEMLAELIKTQQQDMQNVMSDLGDEAPSAQEMEDIEDAAKQLGDKSDDKENQNDAEDLKKQAQALKDEINKNDQEKQASGKPFNTPQQDEIDEETAAKAAALKKAFDELRQNVMEETEDAIDKERIAKKAQDAARFKDTPLSRFRDSLNNFIKREVATHRGTTWTRMNKKYVGMLH